MASSDSLFGGGDGTLPPTDPVGDQAAKDAAAASANSEAEARRTRLALDAGVMVLGAGLAWYGFTHGAWGWKVIGAIGAFFSAYEALILIGEVSSSASSALDQVRKVFGLGTANPPPLASETASTLAHPSATPAGFAVIP